MNIGPLPLTADPAAEPVEEARTVLVVEDDDLVRDTIRLQLESSGWRVTTAADIAVARAALDADASIAVVVCDIHLASESGFSLAGALTELRPERIASEIIFVTGNASSDTAIEALRHRAFDLVRKPVRRADLAQRVAAAQNAAARRRRHQAMLDRLERRVSEGEALKGRLISALRDSRDQNRALEASADQTRHDLLAVISHELKTPLIPIVGLADIMLNSSNLSSEEIREFAGAIRDGGERLDTIISRTLDYLDAERQQADAETCHFEAAEMIAEALHAIAPDATDDGGPRADVSCPDGLRAWGAPQLLGQALQEILGNALQAGPAGVAPRIEARPLDAERVAIDVIDAGPGLPDFVRCNLGVPFLQGDASVTRRWTGVGLGLARALKLARLNGGRLEVGPPPPGGGARLRLILRAAAP